MTGRGLLVDQGPPRLHVQIDGHGPVLLLAHGFAGSARNFNPQVRALRERFRVVRYDARGHARSEAPREATAYTPEAFVEDMQRVLAVAGASEAIIAGLSMGAATALRFALADAQRVRGLVLVSFPPDASAADGFAAVAARFAEAIEREGLEAAGARFVWGPASGLDPRGAALVRQGFLEHPPYALAHVLRGVIARQPRLDELAPALGQLDRPTLVVVGEGDRAGRAPGERLAALMPRAQLVVIPEAGHVVNLDRPAAFTSALVSWLRDQRLDRQDG